MPYRTLITASLLAFVLGLPAHANNQVATELDQELTRIEQLLEQYSAALQAESGSAARVPGSVAAVRAEMERLQQQKAQIESRIEMAARQEAAALQDIAALTKGFMQDWTDRPLMSPGVVPVPTVGPGGPTAGSTVVGATGSPTNPTPSNPPVSPVLADAAPPRVLTRPGAGLFDQPDGLRQNDIPVFSVLYVFDQRQKQSGLWLNVGNDPYESPKGWVEKAKTEDWQNMLVMKYAPSGPRNRVVFFRDDDYIEDLIYDYDYSRLARNLYDAIDAGTYDPSKLTAIEPLHAVDQSDRPYLMPILDWKWAEFDSGFETTLLQLASINLEQGQQAPSRSPSADVMLPGHFSDTVDLADLKDMRIGVTFVIDTTRSMGPYIERTKKFVADIADGLSQSGVGDRFRFGLVAYRDNPSAAPGVDYLTRIVRDLNEPLSGRTFNDQLLNLAVSDSSTVNWREDAFAGLADAMSDMAWEEVNARIIFLITDASARDVGDPLARDPDMGPRTILGLAEDRKIALFFLHINTNEARTISTAEEGYDDFERGRRQYASMQVTGNQVQTKYYSLGGDSEVSFKRALDRLVVDVTETLKGYRRGQPIDHGFGTAAQGGTSEEVSLLSDTPQGLDIDEGNAGIVSSAMINEIFRAQQEYLGARGSTTAPAFYRAWAADRDLVDPRLKTLEVSVFMTLDQISDLAKRLQDIVDRLDSKDAGLGEFFQTVRAGSARAVVDPNIRTIMPAYLKDLPYRSKFLNLTQESWEAMGNGQEELLNEVRDKINLYRRLANSDQGWLNLDNRRPEDRVYPMPLRSLP